MMTIADLPMVMGAVLIAAGVLMVVVQFFLRPSSSNPNIYGALVTMIIVGAVLLGVGAFLHR